MASSVRVTVVRGVAAMVGVFALASLVLMTLVAFFGGNQDAKPPTRPDWSVDFPVIFMIAGFAGLLVGAFVVLVEL